MKRKSIRRYTDFLDHLINVFLLDPLGISHRNIEKRMKNNYIENGLDLQKNTELEREAKGRRKGKEELAKSYTRKE
jgi:hypothetical protein